MNGNAKQNSPIPPSMQVEKYRRPDPHDPKRDRVSISQWEEAISIKDPDIADLQKAVNDFCTLFPDIRIAIIDNRDQYQPHRCMVKLEIYYKGEHIGNMEKKFAEEDYDRVRGNPQEAFNKVFAQDFLRQLLLRGLKSLFDETYDNYKKEKEKAELDADIFNF